MQIFIEKILILFIAIFFSVATLSAEEVLHQNNMNAIEGEYLYYSINIPKNTIKLKVILGNVIGDPDIYVRYGEKPTTSNYECRPYQGSNIDEICNIDNPKAGRWHIMLHAYKDFSTTDLIVTTEASLSNMPYYTLEVKDTEGGPHIAGTEDLKLYKHIGESKVFIKLTHRFDYGGIQNPVIDSITINNIFYFLVSYHHDSWYGGVDLWKSDGTSKGTVAIKLDIFSKSSSRVEFVNYMNGKLYFRFEEYDTRSQRSLGYRLWESDGTEKGTHLSL